MKASGFQHTCLPWYNWLHHGASLSDSVSLDGKVCRAGEKYCEINSTPHATGSWSLTGAWATTVIQILRHSSLCLNWIVLLDGCSMFLSRNIWPRFYWSEMIPVNTWTNCGWPLAPHIRKPLCQQLQYGVKVGWCTSGTRMGAKKGISVTGAVESPDSLNVGSFSLPSWTVPTHGCFT